jgi:hypothetical protein
MPYFTRQVAQNGNLIVDALIGVSASRRLAIIAAGQPVPQPMPVQALIDTGANCLCIDPSVTVQLQLSATGSSSVNTPTTGAAPAQTNQYDISLIIPSSPGGAPLVLHAVPALESQLFSLQGFHAIIGINVLRSCLLHYDGKAGLFSIAW